MKYEYLNEIFKIATSKPNNSTVRNRAIKNKVIPYQCEICGNQAEWNGKKLTLELHHLNGNNKDNRIDNLQFLCPNCHSQTESWRRKKG